jgi:alginate O-acetyltransferase complex protein AlgI
MLFNSDVFIFIFLPIAVVGYFLLGRFISLGVRNVWLVLMSFIFYGFWNPLYVPLLVSSLLFNFYIGEVLSERIHTHTFFSKYRKAILMFGIGANLMLLGFFKYADFILGNINWIFDTDIPLLHVILPLAISFFTFQKIAYLVDSYKQVTRKSSLLSYTLFVIFFPQLIAGPIVHHAEIIPQFADTEKKQIVYRNIALGLFIFCMGLVKKVGIADTFAIWANAGYAYEGALTLYDAWTTSLAYTFQLYFDFSGYTDMAIGAALLFNIELPFNFNSPYKALDIQDFWRRWHMTLSRFLRDYIYIPLGGNRHGVVRMYSAIFLVFLIGGLWHGASWTFVTWGVLHGVAAIVHRLWVQYVPYTMPKVLAWFITFNFVNITWVFFRAESFPKAFALLGSMTNSESIAAASTIAIQGHEVADKSWLLWGGMNTASIGLWIFASLLIVLLCKNSNEWIKDFKPTVLLLLATLCMYMLGVMYLDNFSEFLYFNF